MCSATTFVLIGSQLSEYRVEPVLTVIHVYVEITKEYNNYRLCICDRSTSMAVVTSLTVSVTARKRPDHCLPLVKSRQMCHVYCVSDQPPTPVSYRARHFPPAIVIHRQNCRVSRGARRCTVGWTWGERDPTAHPEAQQDRWEVLCIHGRVLEFLLEFCYKY